MGLNAVAADNGDKITRVHCHGNLQRWLVALGASVLFGVSITEWFWLRPDWELPKSVESGCGYELCQGCGAAQQLLALLANPWNRARFPLPLAVSRGSIDCILKGLSAPGRRLLKKQLISV